VALSVKGIFVESTLSEKGSLMRLLPPRPRLITDGSEDAEGRGLFVVSALHLAARDLQGVDIRILNGQELVRVATEALRWETGLSVEVAPPDADIAAELAGASLFAAVAARCTDHLPLVQVAACGIRSLIAVQFPLSGAGAAALTLVRAAHDPREFGARILAMLGLP
jgi:hypothetical protein